MNLALFLNLDETTDTWAVTTSLVDTPGWQEATESRRQEILDRAYVFLTQCPEVHPDNGVDHRIATAGYQAATLLVNTTPERLEDLDDATWRFWLPSLATTAAGSALREPFHAVVTIAYGHHPQAVLVGLRGVLAIDSQLASSDVLLNALDVCWDEVLADKLMSWLDDPGLPLASRVRCLAALLHHDDARASAHAFEWIEQAAKDWRRAVKAAETLLLSGPSDRVTRLVVQLGSMDPSFTRDALQSVADALGSPVPTGRFPANADEQTLAALYVLTCELFPPSGDAGSWHGTNPWTDPLFRIAQFRGALLRWLAAAGAWPAVEALERVIDDHPTLPFPRAHWRGAVQTTLLQTWSSLVQPQAIVAVVADQQQRIIHNVDQFLDLVLESLGRLQLELIERGAVADLWSEWMVDGRLQYRPKRELSVADNVKRFLDRDLAAFTVVANREVENQPGNETDILVQYIDRDPAGNDVRRLTVVIEVKGSFHGEVRTAMRTQLAERYLSEYETDRGIYLVVWFSSERWDQTDAAWARSRSHDLDALRATLQQQACELTDERRRIETMVLDAALREKVSRSTPRRGTRAQSRRRGT